jgi:hypothetical protein
MGQMLARVRRRIAGSPPLQILLFIVVVLVVLLVAEYLDLVPG